MANETATIYNDSWAMDLGFPRVCQAGDSRLSEKVDDLDAIDEAAAVCPTFHNLSADGAFDFGGIS